MVEGIGNGDQPGGMTGLSMNVDVSIIILSWNDRQHLEECLDSLSHCTKSRRVEIIVVDNASTDGSPAVVETRFPTVKLIKNKENLGFPKGNNLGLLASSGKYVCLLNSDIKVLDGCIDALADYMDAHAEIGMAGPKILNEDMTHQSSCRRFPGWWNNFCSATGLASVFPRSEFFSGEHMFYFKGDRPMTVDVLVGCFWMVRREAIQQTGPLDECFFMYAEDVDWCKRFWKAGWRVAFYPQAQAIHYGGGSSSKRDPAWVELMQQRSLLCYWKKHHGLVGRLGVRLILVVHRVIRWAGALIDQLASLSKRGESRTRARVNWACLRDLFSNHDKNIIKDEQQRDCGHNVARLARLQDLITRFSWYARRHGLQATVKRTWLALKRTLTENRLVLFYCDLGTFKATPLEGAAGGKIERITAETGLDARNMLRIANVGPPEIVQRQFSERFARGASLWLFKKEDQVAGYGWTLTGRTMEPHFFPLGSNDVHMFDFFVFPEYRGQRINLSLMVHILSTLASERKGRVFIEAAEWNTPQLHSLSRMPFERLGSASKFRLFGRTIVVWTKEHKIH
jgi:GT2 family glycosyltransferase/ribosomal protein S18 acetylase RimI-like enzyme